MEETLSTYENDLLTTYDRTNAIEPYERLSTPFLNAMKEVGTMGKPLRGNVLEFQLRLHAAYSIGAPSDGGQMSRARQHKTRKAQVTKATIDGTLTITLETQEAAEGEGSFTGDALKDAVDNTLEVYYYQKNILALGHGTGRLGIVAADAAATDTVTFDLPDSVFKFRPGLPVEFADLDEGGTVQNLGAVGLEVFVESIDHLTQTIVFTSPITVSATWGAYIAGTYGARRPNGMLTFIDNGTLTDTVMGLSRADNPELNATIMDNGGALQDYSEALSRTLLSQIAQVSGRTPSSAWSNAGLINEHYRFTTPDRMFTISAGDGGVPKYNIGANESDLAIHFRGKRIPWKFDEDMPARMLAFNYDQGYRMHTMRKDDWLKGENGILRLAPADGGGTFKYAYIGAMIGSYNVSQKFLNAQGALTFVRDRDSAGD